MTHYTDLIDQLEKELNLPRSARGTADFAKARAHQVVSWQTHVDDVEQVEKLRAKLQIHQLDTTGSPPQRSALDQRKMEVVISRPAESIAAQRAESPWFGPVLPGTLIGIEK